MIVGNNCAGIKNKRESLSNLIFTVNPGIIFLQETKLYTKGLVKIPNFFVFETIRAQKGGGGLITAVHEKLNPMLIESEQNIADILSVRCQIGAKSVHLINGYGPQESDAISLKDEFFMAFESAIQSAILNGDLICAELDANSKIGMENIPSDPHHISANGQMLMDIVKRNGLIVVNSTNKCSGVITRIRKTLMLEEKSVLDYFIVCPRFFQLIISMEIDEERKFVLTKYSNRMGKKCVKESDHNPLFCKLNVKWDKKIPQERKEIFKLKDKEGLHLFSRLTSNCPKLVQLSQNSSNFPDDAEKWMKKIEDIKHKSFKKIRLTGKSKPQNDDFTSLMKAKQDLQNKLVNIVEPVLKSKIFENIFILENEISIVCSEKKTQIVKEHINELSNGSDQLSRLNMWRLKQKLCPRNSDPPMAKKDQNGVLVSNPDELKSLYLETYKQRLRKRTIRPG